jgi:glycosyltransferase involved in cell wall biosynthesis
MNSSPSQNTREGDTCKSDPLVTVVIPTHERPALVVRAVRSALQQSYANLEVVVVLDGPDDLTKSALENMPDRRIRTVQLPVQSGGSDARNAGVQVARGEWIAFLDDDDEWVPRKIEHQINRALLSSFETPIVSSQLFVLNGRSQLIWPRKAPSKPLCEYLLSRNSWSYGEGVVSTITLLVPRRLLLEVPFKSGLRKYQDFDWLLRAVERPDVGIEFIPEPLAIWHVDAARNSVGTAVAWEASWDWIQSQRMKITARAYSGFIVTQMAPQAVRQGRWRSFFPLLRETLFEGNPTPFHIALYFFMWLTPYSIRSFVRHSGATKIVHSGV